MNGKSPLLAYGDAAHGQRRHPTAKVGLTLETPRPTSAEGISIG